MAQRGPTEAETQAFLAELNKQRSSSAGNPYFGSMGALAPVSTMLLPNSAQVALDIGREAGNQYYEHPGQSWAEVFKMLLTNPSVRDRLINKATSLFVPRAISVKK